MNLTGTSGAIFNGNKKERYVLWRNWNPLKPKVLFIGLNPSIADEGFNDPTTKRIMAHSKRLGFGGCFLMNCFTQITTDPKKLSPTGNWKENIKWLEYIAPLCSEVIFAWGKHSLVKEMARDCYFENYFPKAKCLGNNKDGSPKHPLYLPYSSRLHRFKYEKS